jgi:acyl-CoA reductase-like NAD-dependent aldehyde dehydrogenase
LQSDTADAEAALAGAFGPVVLIREVPDPDSAVAAANSSHFALGASVWSRNSREARRLAGMLEAGMVGINEAVTPTAHAGAPFGGCKASGFGRAHGVLGLREFTHSQTLFQRRPGGFRPQLFPYGDSSTVQRYLAVYRHVFHRR